MEYDEDGVDDEPVRPLLPPDDRLWRHPSEVRDAPLPSWAAPSREPRLLTVVALTSSISVLLTLGLVAVVRPVRTTLAVEQVAPPAHATTSRSPASDIAGIAASLKTAILPVTAFADDVARDGSGVVYRSDGMVLTTHHLVDGAGSVQVTLADGRALPARVVGSDPETDLAVLDVDGERFDVAPLGTALGLKVGQPAITIGTPDESGGPVVTVGVVSATGQHVDAPGRQLLDMIQTDSPVAAGCAGGAVVDDSGVVIGIATVNVAREGGSSGYATPIDVARLVAGQLVAHGRVTRGWLGVEGDDVGPNDARDLGLRGGVVVKAIKDASPAAKAGIVASDILTKIDGDPLESMADLVVELRTRRPGDTVALAVVRAGEPRVLKVTLAEKP